MEHDFDKSYWDEHWQRVHDLTARPETPPHPYLMGEVSDLVPGTALEAGCGEGAEAIWLGRAGWKVTAADIADEALARAADRAAAHGLRDDQIQWVQADLSSWEPPNSFDLVTTHYAHPAMPQLAFYDRLSSWVSPGGSLLIVGHLQPDPADHHDHQTPVGASVTAVSITERLDPDTWDVVTAEEHTRTPNGPGAGQVTLHDVVVRAVRRTDAEAGR